MSTVSIVATPPQHPAPSISNTSVIYILIIKKGLTLSHIIVEYLRFWKRHFFFPNQFPRDFLN